MAGASRSTPTATGTREIYVMNADGSGVIRLTYNDADDLTPAWSPDGSVASDGRRIAFASPTTTVGPGPTAGALRSPPIATEIEIYVMNASGVTRLTYNDAHDSWTPAWSPDGRRIAFTSRRDGNPEIYVMNAAGEPASTRLTPTTRRSRLGSCRR